MSDPPPYIPFNRPFIVGRELEYMEQAVRSGRLSGGGEFSRKCEAWLEREARVHRAMLVPSCTAGLEMAALLIDLQPGDEVILPSFTFVSTANAFVLRGAVPVFVDIQPETLNLDPAGVEAAITPRTRAIVPVHYAGVSCDMDRLVELARAHNLRLIEDAAQAVQSSWKGRPLGSFGDLAAYSFHETKNFISGEGGALVINDPELVERAEIIREKGTNRTNFFKGLTDKYTWVDLGSSFLPSELVSAFLYAQLEHADEITARRLALWNRYHQAFADLEARGRVRRPIIPAHCTHNAHLYYLLLRDGDDRDRMLQALNGQGIGAVFHYVPLHNAPMARKILPGEPPSLPVTEATSARLLRLPLYFELSEADQDRVIRAVLAAARD